MRAGLTVALGGLLFLAGCVVSERQSGGPGFDDPAVRTTVIAVIDTGANPYHPVFVDTRPFEIHAQVVPLLLSSTGTINERLDQDVITLSQMRHSTLYHVEGTRLLMIGFDESAEGRDVTLDRNNHGAATTVLAAIAAPDAIVVSIRITTAGCDPSSCLHPESFARAIEWAAAQPWIDVITTSLGFTGNPPDTHAAYPEAERWVAASRAASESGKLLVNSAGNEATPGIAQQQKGMPWVIAVGGIEHNASGEKPYAGKLVDVVANYSEYLQVPWDLDEWDWYTGTSFAAPSVAGTLAQSIALTRAADPTRDIDPNEFRAALNASAVYFNATDWNPTAVKRGDAIRSTIFGTSLPILLQPQMGWGYVNGTLAPEISRRVLENDLSVPTGKEQAAAFQTQWQAAREEYWARYG